MRQGKMIWILHNANQILSDFRETISFCPQAGELLKP
jgi:hypothetical protein